MALRAWEHAGYWPVELRVRAGGYEACPIL